MDGRVQEPVINFLKKRFNAEYVDSITEAGPNLILSENRETVLIESILDKLNISVEKHGSAGIAVAGHYDCAGNPSSQNEQALHIKKSIQFLKQNYKDIEIIGLWVDKDWRVHELT